MAQQNAMDGVARQSDALPCQHHLQLAGAPIRITLARLDDALLQSCRCALRANQRPAAAFRYPEESLLLVPLHPEVARRTRDSELLAQGTKRLRTSLRRGHKLHALLINIHRPPRHPIHLRRSIAPECKGCLGTRCKGCRETEHTHSAGESFRT